MSNSAAILPPLTEPTAPPADTARAGAIIIPPDSLAWQSLDELAASSQDVQTLQQAMMTLKKQGNYRGAEKLGPALERARIRLGTATVMLADGWRAAVDQWKANNGN